MINTSKAKAAMEAYGLGTYKLQKYVILPQRIVSAINNNRLNLINLQDINDLCDLLCCRPEDLIEYSYVDPRDEDMMKEAMAEVEHDGTADAAVEAKIKTDFIKGLLD